MRREFIRWSGLATLLLFGVVGCNGEPFIRVPDADEEFSTPADYQNYDLEMRELSAGQSE
ncbi:hypothetical protein [Aporhodopirellula aestuarii]|uniref:Secreted protein n=1 Tax=Aporhodopirellula aestuarii TaxID=2950107 RepID=A0ABT0UCE5_9BACT|nr:hypothetical protein [Aporhodopirellula aestuarii]MCM2374521.1 hypothetical protein [Aporhodopirellula aestuarii]